jgi:hypothetical protein
MARTEKNMVVNEMIVTKLKFRMSLRAANHPPYMY